MSPYDMRRVFITFADERVPRKVVEILTDHQDRTTHGGYLAYSFERLLSFKEHIEGDLMRAAKGKVEADIVEMRGAG